MHRAISSCLQDDDASSGSPLEWQMKIIDMKRITEILLVAAAAAFMVSCSTEEDSTLWNPAWDDEEQEEPADPDEPEGGDGIVGKPRYVWIDAAANFADYADSKENIEADMQKIKDAGFTDVIVDVRPTSGDVLFSSSTASPLTRVDAWTERGYVWLERTATFDYLQAFIDAGHALGLRVNASINTFVGGYLCPYGLGSDGMLFRDSSRKGWASEVNTADGIVNVMDLLDDEYDYGPKFLNPANDDAQEYVLDILSDLAEYDVDGIILDRCRYDDYGLMSDFSDESRQKFEEYAGYTVENWPDDIFSPGTDYLPSPVTEEVKLWLEFRAKVIHDFVVKAGQRVHSVNPEVRFGAYVGAWYSTYYTSGVNWASPKYDPSADYSWASSKYKDYGYADHCDFMFLGAYASADSIYGSGEWTMQGFCEQGKELLMGDTEFAGGPDIGNSTGWTEGGQAALIPDVIDACITPGDGFFVFDLCHIKMYDYWDAFKTGFDEYLSSLQQN